MCRVLGLGRVPNYSTFCRACNRIKGKEIKRLLGKVLEIVISSRDVGFLFACDSTGFKEEVMDRGFDGSGNFRLGFPIRVIPPIRRGGSIRSLDRIYDFQMEWYLWKEMVM